jgi:hypothetical protein
MERMCCIGHKMPVSVYLQPSALTVVFITGKNLEQTVSEKMETGTL